MNTPHAQAGQNGELPFTDVFHPSGSSCRIYHQGAHLSSFKTWKGEEQLFLSETSFFKTGKAIRGGIPVIFPQFADVGPLPKHGFARTELWQQEAPAAFFDGRVFVSFRLQESAATRAIWDFPFALRLNVFLDATSLDVQLEVENTGSTAFNFTAALHTYFKVADFFGCSLKGLGGISYTDRGSDFRLIQEDQELPFTGPLDRIYWSVPTELMLRDKKAGRTVQIQSENASETVVWNPGRENSAGLPDMTGEAFREMLCVEAAVIEKPVVLNPGEKSTLSQTLSVTA